MLCNICVLYTDKTEFHLSNIIYKICIQNVYILVFIEPILSKFPEWFKGEAEKVEMIVICINIDRTLECRKILYG